MEPRRIFEYPKRYRWAFWIPERYKYLGSGPVTRSFFELLDLLRLRGHDGGSGLSIERDTCFVNIVGHTGPHGS